MSSSARSSAASTSSSSSSRDPRKLWLGNLDTGVPEIQVLKLVEPFGKVEKFDFVYAVHPDSGARTPRGFAFVTYELPESAARAVRQLDGKTLAGRRLHAKPANSVNPSWDVAESRKRRAGDGALRVVVGAKQMSKEEKIRAMESKLRALDSQGNTFKWAVPKKS
jgi:RNA recognition motif-containing protein